MAQLLFDMREVGVLENMRFWYPASITQITEMNDSFDSCVLRVCYAGKNRNRSIISKETIEAAIPTMPYCPLVANYNVEDDSIGGHDIDIVKTDDGTMKMVNLTDAVGVIPENPQWNWTTVQEEDGTEHDYLCVPAILWKRTPIYEKLKRDGICGQSMEIKVDKGRFVDGLFEVDAFSFTAFCLLGDDVEPCFESAQVELFSANRLSERFSLLMEDLKNQFSVMTAAADDNRAPDGDNSFTKGGEGSLVDELMKKYGLTAEDIDFDVAGMDASTLEARFAEIAKKFDSEEPEQSEEPGDANADDNASGDDAADGEDGDQPDEQDDDDDDAPGGTVKRNYQLTGEQLGCGIREALRAVTYTDEWGEWGRYGYVDYDAQVREVYAYDYLDFNLYGFKYSMNGDNVVIDFESKRRKRFAFVDFDMGDAQFNYEPMFAEANSKFAAVCKEIGALREYKLGIERAERKAKAEEVFSMFGDLEDDARFTALKTECANSEYTMAVQDIEEKCYAIRGRRTQLKFSQDTKPTRILVGHQMDKSDEPYGGVFVEFGVGK